MMDIVFALVGTIVKRRVVAMKKLLSILLTLSMVLSLVPSQALAEAIDEYDGAVEEGMSQALGDDASDEQGTPVEGIDATEDADVADDADASAGGVDATDDDDVATAQRDDVGDTDTSAADDTADPARDADAAAAVDTTDSGIEDASDQQAEPANEDEEAHASAEGDADGAQRAPALEADPFCFVDLQTGQHVTTLHTSGSYRLVNPSDGTPYEAKKASLQFCLAGASPRDDLGAYDVSLREVDEDGDGTTDYYVLEDPTYYVSASGCSWQLPTGTYEIGYEGPQAYKSYHLRQTYQVVNDGNFLPMFDFSGYYAYNNGSFSVKAYDADKDAQGEQGGADYGEDNYNETPEQSPFVLGSDTRIKLRIDTAATIDSDHLPQLESLSLWRADETLDAYRGYEDEETGEFHSGVYKDLDRSLISRDANILGKAGIDALPTWPHILNFADDSHQTTLWQRGVSTQDVRLAISQEALDENEGLTDADFVFDCANFADVVATDGLYFPVATMSFRGETYTFAYFPIEVSAKQTTPRVDPRIATTKLPNGLVGDAYNATLKAKSGATTAGELSWAVTDGQLPAGLALDQATGVISGTPTEAGKQTFTVTLTETVDGEALTTTRDLSISVGAAAVPQTALDQLSLGEIDYDHGPVFLKHHASLTNSITLRIPISIDLRDERYNLGETELWYMARLQAKPTADDVGESEKDTEPVFRLWRARAADLINEDGTMLVAPVTIEGTYIHSTKVVTDLRAFLVAKDNEGNYAFDLGETADGGGWIGSTDGIGYWDEPLGVTYAYRYSGLPADEDGSYRDEIRFIEYSYEEEVWSEHHYGGQDGDSSYSYRPRYPNTPDMPHVSVENPDISIGARVRFSQLHQVDEAQTVERARVRLWAYDGTTTIPGTQQVKSLGVFDGSNEWATYDRDEGAATFMLASGTYACVVEGAVPVYDENGVAIAGKTAWVDIASSVAGARALKGTAPQQYVFSVGPDEGEGGEFDIRIKYLDVNSTAEHMEDTESHTISPLFETESGSFVEEGAAQSGGVPYDTLWYRKVNAGTAEECDVLIATGNNVRFGLSDYPLYVEVKPTGRGATYWRSSGKVRVSDKNKTVSVQVRRRQLFSGTFTLSCASGKHPDDGMWGVIEVRTPVLDGDLSSFNVWCTSNPIVVPNISSGSIVTFTPCVDLDAGPVEYVVPDDASEDFEVELVAPLPKGTISFEGLSFVDVEGTTTVISLNDGATDVSVKRMGDPDHPYGINVPFRVTDASSIVLQPELSGGNYFEDSDADVTYSVAVTRRDPYAPARLGVQAPDYAARCSFDVTLSKTKTTATVERTTLTSRGYAVVPLENPDDTPCTLLLYPNDYFSLRDKTAAAFKVEGQQRTVFLEEGSYTLYAVNSNTLRSLWYEVEPIQLSYFLESGEATCVTFEVQDATVTTTETLVFPRRQEEELINHEASSVDVASKYGDNVSITMHAELAEGITLTEDARLEITTNQTSNIWGEGYMSPRALSFNGRALTLHRWENLFNQTQCMGNGKLTILLSEAGVVGEFPLDMTLVIPRTDMSYTEATIWLVSNGGMQRSLVGSCRKETHEASLEAPAVSAWKTFAVHGETVPNAVVTVYLDGMRAATTAADEYGYYTTQVTLPYDAHDYEMFSVSALAQWSYGYVVGSATSPTAKVVYSTTYPTIERVTLCYQKHALGKYYDCVAYERGSLPNKYLSLYRAENERFFEGLEHAKYFWLVEFANGDAIKEGSVEISLERSSDTLSLTHTESLTQAEAWIDDVKLEIPSESPLVTGASFGAKTEAGQRVRNALGATSTRAFVTEPVYLYASPDDLDVSFQVDFPGADEPEVGGIEKAADQGAFRGFHNERLHGEDEQTQITEEGLQQLLTCMSENHIWATANPATMVAGSSVSASSVMGTEAWTRQLRDATEGSTDEWLLLGTGAQENEQVLKLHHQVSTTSMTKGQIQATVQGLLDEALPKVEKYEHWLQTGEAPADDSDYQYKGLWICDAGGVDRTGSESDLYLIETMDDEGESQLESLHKYQIEDSDEYVYYLLQAEPSVYTMTIYNEKYGQCRTYIYTIAADQQSPCKQMAELLERWYCIFSALNGGFLPWGQTLGTDDGTDDQGAQHAPSLSQGTSHASQDGSAAALPEGTTVASKSTSRDAALGLIGDLQVWVAANVGIWSAEKGGILYDMCNFFTDLENIRTGKDNDCTHPEYSFKQNTLGGKHLANGTTLAVEATTNMGVKVGVAGATSTDPFALWTYVSPFVPTDRLERAYKDMWSDASHIWNDLIWDRERYNAEKDFDEFAVQKYLKDRGKPYSMKKWTKKQINDYSKRYKWEEDNQRKFKTPNPSVTHDPSGIVYEAVLSNPVAGATVSLYKYNEAAAKAGLADPAQFVDSTKFGIEDNPQVTDASGGYQWFVPTGHWQVRVTKSGYESFNSGTSGHEEQRPQYQVQEEAELDDEGNPVIDEAGNPVTRIVYNPVLDAAGNPVMQTIWVGDYGLDATRDIDGDGVDEAKEYWMPVLPVQLDVNIPLVSKAAPTVEEAEADTSGVTITFSKYLKVASVSAKLFAVEGARITAIKPLDAEQAGDGSGELLARTYKLTFEEGTAFATDQTSVALSINDTEGAIRSYADVAMEEHDRVNAQYVATLHIEQNDLARATVAAIKDQPYAGKAATPAVTVKLDGATLVKGADYTVRYTNNTKVGTAKVIITGINDYKGSTSASFRIVKGTQIITVSKSSLALTMGKTSKLGAKTSGGGKLTYVSSAKTLVAVSSIGVLTPKNVTTKKVIITITAAETANYKKATKKVTITKVVQGTQAITVAKNECVTGKTASLGAKTSGNGKLTYKSANPKVATVSAKGVVKGLKAGSVKITITAAATKNYKKATKVVTVKVGKANPITAKAKKSVVVASFNTLKSKSVVTALNVSTAKAQGTLSWANASTNATAKKFKVDAKTGKVTVPKGTPKGKYQVKVTVKAKGTSAYISGTKTVAYYIQVK